MKLDQLITPLNEGMLKRAAAAGLAVLALTSPINFGTVNPAIKNQTLTASDRASMEQMTKAQRIEFLVGKVAEKYHADPAVIRAAVKAAEKYAYSDFPRASDILGVISVESSFIEKSVSKLKKDPAIGLMQVRPGVNGLSRTDLSSIDDQIRIGTQILRKYYEKTGDKSAALHAYNVGLTNHYRSMTNPKKGNPRYAPKVERETERYKLPPQLAQQ